MYYVLKNKGTLIHISDKEKVDELIASGFAVLLKSDDYNLSSKYFTILKNSEYEGEHLYVGV